MIIINHKLIIINHTLVIEFVSHFGLGSSMSIPAAAINRFVISHNISSEFSVSHTYYLSLLGSFSSFTSS